jgi:hypothetical protein
MDAELNEANLRYEIALARAFALREAHDLLDAEYTGDLGQVPGAHREIRGRLFRAVDELMAKKKVLDAAFEAAEERLTPPIQKFSTPDEAEEWAERAQHEMDGETARLEKLLEEWDSIPLDVLNRTAGDATLQDVKDLGRLIDLAEEANTVIRSIEGSQATLDQATKALEEFDDEL